MRLKPRGRDERGAAMVSVLVMMLVLTLFALTLAAIVTNTSSTVALGRSESQARAAADAGIAAALAAFDKAEKCTGTITSATAPVYSVTCTLNTNPVTFTSTGSAVDGRQITVQAVYDYTIAQSYGAKVGGLTYFSAITTMVQPNTVTSTTTDPARITGIVGDFHCASVLDANLVVEKDFYADDGCTVKGWVKAKGTATVSPNSKVMGNLTGVKNVNLNSPSSVGGSLFTGGNASIGNGSSVGADVTAVGTVTVGSVNPGSKLSIGGKLTSGGYVNLGDNSSVGGDLVTGGYAELASGTSVGGNLTSVSYSNVGVAATIKGDLTSGGIVTTGDRSSITGTVAAAGEGGTVIRGGVSEDVIAAGSVAVYGIVTGAVTAAGTGSTLVNGTVNGNVKAAGDVTVNGTVTGDVTAAGAGKTSVYGTVSGSLKAAGAIYVHNNRTVSGAVTSAGTAEASLVNGNVGGSVRLARADAVNGNISGDLSVASGAENFCFCGGSINGSLKVAGSVKVDYSRIVGANVTSSGTGTDVISGRITGDLNAGGPVNMVGGSIWGNLTLPDVSKLTPKPATGITGTVTRKAAPPAPSAPDAPSAPTVSLTTPEVTVGAPADPTIPTWQDYGYSVADWPGYTVKKARCADSNWATDLAATTPIILDATACSGGLSNHPAGTTPVIVGANVVVVSSKIDIQNLTFQLKSGTTPSMWFVVPSAAKAVKKYSVTSGSGDIVLYSTTFGVPAVLYTPGRIKSTASSFLGSMYAGGADFTWQTPAGIQAAPVDFPIPLFDSDPSSGTGTFSRTLESQREVG